MAKKPTITTVATGYQATDTINSNTVALRDAFDNTLSLDGSTPNAMEADLDLNGNDILNVNNIYVDNIIYDGALPIANGGTGASTASGARTNLGLGTLATQNGTFSGTSSGTNTGDQNIFRTIAVSGESNVVADSTTDTLTLVAGSGISITTNASTDSITITNTNSSATLTDISNLTPADNTFIVGNGTTWVAESGSTVRTSLGLGTMATETATNYLTTSSAASTYQPLDSDLTTLGGLAKTDGNFIVGDGTNWVAESGATARASLGLGTMSTETASNYLTTASAASTYQPLDSDLTAIAGLTSAADRLPYFTGSGTATLATFTSAGRALVDDADAAAQRTTLGLGTLATQNSNNVSITGGSVTGITDLAVADGGTGASDAATARTNLAAAGTGVTNTFTANQIVSVTDNTNAALRITQLGTGNALLVEDSTNPDATPIVVTSDGTVVVGHTAALNTDNYAGTQITPKVQIQGVNNQNSTLSATTWVAGSGGPQIALGKSRSATVGTNTVVQSGDVLGAVTFAGDDGTAIIIGASILGESDGTPGTNDMPGRLVFSTTADGASTSTERMRIASDGKVGIGTTAADALLSVNGVASFGDGAAATPSITNIGDLNTGIYFPSADTIGISTNGTQRLSIDSSGVTTINSLALTNDLAVTHGGTGASTTYEARDNLKFPKMVTPEDFGATGSSTISGATADQASYIQSALDHLASNGGGILYLNKWYRIATALTYGTSTTNPGSIAVVGTDPNRSGIVTTTGIDGLKFTIASNGDWNVFIQNIGLIRNSSNTAGTAITIKSVAVIGDTATGGDKGHTITNCIIDTASTGYWNKGISLYQCPHSQIFNNWIKGRGAITTTKSGVGIELDVYNMGCKLYYNVIRGFQKAFSVDDTSFFAYTSEGNAVTVRANSTAYTVGQEITVSSNYYCKFRCTTAGTTASSLPAGYASANDDSTITDGTAVFLALTFQAEGFSFNNNKVQVCDYGTYVNMRDTEVAWKFSENDYDVNQIHMYLRNLNGTVISNNSFGKSNTLSASQNIVLVSDDGNPSGPTLTDDNLNHVIIGNRAFGSTLEMSLDISSITKGSTTTVNYTLTSGYTQYPNNGDYIFITNVSSMTEINEKLFRVGSATTSSFVLLDPEDSSNINSTSYTTFSGSGKVKYANVFATIISGSLINIHSNHCQAKNLGVYIGRNTSDISIEGITVPNGVVFQNRSTSDTVYIDTTAYQIDQTNQGILTLAGKSTNTGSPGIRLGRTDALSSTPYIDFYTYGDPNYRNVRIIASGGSAALDTGTLTYKAATHSFEGTTNITGTTSIIGETDVTNAAGNRSFTVSGSGNGSIYINGGTGQTRSLFLQTGTSLRWTIRANATAESGSNVGSDLQILRYDDTGTVIDTPFFIKRSTGRVGIGTTSPACLLDVSGGISTGSSAVTSPAATDGNIFSGTYTPTLTGVTNVASSTAYTTSYMRVGNVVTVAGRIAIDPTATGQTSIGMSLPISSTLGASQALGGTFAFGTDSGQVGAISGDVTNNRASFDILTNSAANRSYYFSFTYRVI